MGSRGTSLDEYFGSKIDELSNRELRNELLILGDNKAAHPRTDIAYYLNDTIHNRAEKYKFLTKKCHKRNNSIINNIISYLNDKYLGSGKNEYHEDKKFIPKNIRWNELTQNSMFIM